MNGLLDKYNDCNIFSLTYYNANDVKISEEEKNKLLLNIANEEVEQELKKDRENYLQNLSDNLTKLPTDIIKNEILKNNLIRYELSFENSCTIAGYLMINYYFKLNDETKVLLNNFKSDFDIDIDSLEDLCLYKDNELKFYSCTHEGYNSLN